MSAQVIRERMRPPTRMTLSQWADAYRVLSAEASAEPGPWRTDRAPYLREILDTAGDVSTSKMVWVAASQLGKTEVGNNFVGMRVQLNPGPMLVVQPTLDMAKTWSKDRLAPMLRDSEVLRGRVLPSRTRDSGNTLFHKAFPGGHLSIVGANSASGLSSRPIRDVVLDEVDRYPPSAGAEGDPALLAIQRTANFWNRTVLWISSPGELETSRIWPEWLGSDQRLYFVPCPHCREYQVLVWKGLQWATDVVDGEKVRRPETASYACEACGVLIDQAAKRSMLTAGEWRPQNPNGRWPGFHLPSLYSPWVTWPELAEKWLDAQGDRELLKTFLNLQLGEPWREQDLEKELDTSELASRAETYAAEIPHGVGVLTASIDVQGDRLELLVKGWGARQESWMIGHHRLYGDPESAELWGAAETLLAKGYRHESGRDLRIRACFVDSGHLRDVVYAWVRSRQLRGIHAVKGATSRQRELLHRSTRKNRMGVKLWTVDTWELKTRVFHRVRIAQPGPGYMHFCRPTGTGADAEYFAQFGAEVRKKVRIGGRYQYRFVEVRERNEAIDLEVYALAALLSMGAPVLDRLVELAEVAGSPPPDADDEEEPPARPRSTGWVNKWRK